MGNDSRGELIGYWITTGLLVLVLIAGGVLDLMDRPEITAVMGRLGYPAYLGPLLGVSKLVAAVIILAPGLLRLKEWAYAGVVIELVGAIYSHFASETPAQIVAPTLLVLLALASWYLRPRDRKLPTPIKIK